MTRLFQKTQKKKKKMNDTEKNNTVWKTKGDTNSGPHIFPGFIKYDLNSSFPKFFPKLFLQIACVVYKSNGFFKKMNYVFFLIVFKLQNKNKILLLTSRFYQCITKLNKTTYL